MPEASGATAAMVSRSATDGWPSSMCQSMARSQCCRRTAALSLHSQRLSQQRSIDWRGESDTEVLIEAISTWGLDQTLDAAVGMFAFCIYDQVQQTASLVRDRFGEKPCYFSLVNAETLIFGSELRCLEAHPAFQGEIDSGAVSDFVQLGYVPASKSIYRNVARLPAASVLSFQPKQLRQFPDANSLLTRARIYWSAMQVYENALSMRQTSSASKNCDAESREVELALTESIAAQLQADVPVGIFLSGGIDSPTITALAQKLTVQPVSTFSIGIADQSVKAFADSSNEATRAAAIAAALGTEHHEFYVTPATAAEAAMTLADVYDEPFADPSQLPTTLVAKLASQRVKVCLTGDGGDELFAGYNRHTWIDRHWPGMFRLPRRARSLLSASIAGIGEYRWDRFYSAVEGIIPTDRRVTDPGLKLQKLSRALRFNSPADVYRSVVCRVDNTAVLVNPSTPLGLDLQPAMQNATPLDQFQMWDMSGYLQNAILTKVDRASMHHGLETRLPYLDPTLVRLAMQTDPTCKINANRGKYVLRQIFTRLLPSIDPEQPKTGFIVPLDHWLRREHSLKAWADDLLSPADLDANDWLDTTAVRELWRQHQNGTHNHIAALWNVIMLQAWLAARR